MISPMDRVRISLRAATSADYDFLWNLNRAAQGTYVEATWGWDEAFQRDYFDKRFDPATRQIVQFEGRDVGMWGLEQRADCVFVAEIGLLPEFQRLGIGTKLLTDALAEAGRREVQCRLQVLRVNPARALYERLGFQVTGETETHFEMEAL